MKSKTCVHNSVDTTGIEQKPIQEEAPRPPVQADEKLNFTQSPTGRGRPKGSKNRTTLLQEAIKNDFTRLAKMRSRKIFEKLTEEAMRGEPWAVKLFMDKLLPNADAGDGMLRGGVTVEINISDMKPDLRIVNEN